MLMAPRLKWMVAPAVIFELLLVKKVFDAGINPAVRAVPRLLAIKGDI
jgi:hypothetical protein